MNRSRSYFWIGVFLVGTVARATEQTYGPFKIWEIKPPDPESASVAAINELGDFCGTYFDSAIQRDRPFVGNLGFQDAIGRNNVLGFVSGLGAVDLNLRGENAGATDINNGGGICGWSDDRSGAQAAAAWSAGRTGSGIVLLPGNDVAMDATGINDSQVAVGTGTHWMNGWNATTWVGRLGTWHGWNLKLAPAVSLYPEAQPNDINNAGSLCGSYLSAAGERAYLRRGESITTLPIPDGWRSKGIGMNDGGSVVGQLYKMNGQSQPAFWHSRFGFFSYLSSGMVTGSLSSVNIHNQAVGWEQDAMGDQRAILFRPGIGTWDLNRAHQNPDWKLTEATAINDVGQIVGWGIYKGRKAMFQLDPWGWRYSFGDETRVTLSPAKYNSATGEWNQDATIVNLTSTPIAAQVWLDVVASARLRGGYFTDNGTKYVYVEVGRSLEPGETVVKSLRFDANPGVNWKATVRQGGMWQR